MNKVKRVLVSVSDKSGLVDFARELTRMDIEIISTGGTKKVLEENGIPVRSISDYTGFPEMLDGRLKTLHPKIHGGLLAQRGNQKHMEEIKKNDLPLIDMVVVNLYPFKTVIQREGVSLEEAVENIDIGGPAMLRSAAKNFKDVAVITSSDWYPKIIEELKQNAGSLKEQTKARLAIEVFALTADYDKAIRNYLNEKIGLEKPSCGNSFFEQELILKFSRIQELRYGENPQQKACFYRDLQEINPGLAQMKQLHGKELSFNNIMDVDAAYSLAAEFEEPAAVIIKHNNPCGAASASNLSKAYIDALASDPLSAFGGIVGFNRVVDEEVSQAILAGGFLECIIAPGFQEDALRMLEKRKNLRLITCALPIKKEDDFSELDFKKVSGGLLVQSKDKKDLGELKTVTKIKPSAEEMKSLIFAWKVAKFVKSNAIVIASGKKIVGIGAGQMSRVDAVIIAGYKAGERAKGASLASDAFFPKPDGIEEAVKAGVKAVIQPGGSIEDEVVIAAADKHKIAMVFTGIRHFKH